MCFKASFMSKMYGSSALTLFSLQFGIFHYFPITALILAIYPYILADMLTFVSVLIGLTQFDTRTT